MAASSELKWLMSDNEVPLEVQSVLYHLGFTKIKVFIGIGESRQEVRTVLANDVGLDPAADIPSRVAVAMVLAAWEAARSQVQREQLQKAEAKAAHVPTPVGSVDHQAMRAAYELRFGRLDNQEVPSRSYLGTKQEEIEENEPRAESLKEVASREDAEVEFLTADIGSDGQIKVRRGHKDGKMPANAEELRLRHKIVGHAWLFLRTKHTNRGWLADLDDRSFPKVSDYLLSRHIAGVVITSVDGKTHHPPWALILSYEQEIRRRAYELITTQNLQMQAALVAVMQDANVRERYFTAPLALGAVSFPVERPIAPVASSSPGGKAGARQPQRRVFNAFGGGRGKGGGKRGGKKSSGKGAGLKSRTPDGRDICYRYNNRNESCDGRCNRVHCCQRCLGKHPAYECSAAASSGGDGK